jgi:hypothetical protein
MKNEITAKQLRQVILEKARSASSAWINISDYIIIDRFDSLYCSKLAGKKYPKDILIEFHHCHFKEHVLLKNTTTKPFSFNFKHCFFEKQLNVRGVENKGQTRIDIFDTIINSKERAVIGLDIEDVQSVSLKTITTTTLYINYRYPLKTAHLSIGKLNVHSIRISGQETVEDISIYCHDSLVNAISRFFPLTPFKGIELR